VSSSRPILAEFRDDSTRFADAKARRNYAGISPITRASGTRKIVLARYARNTRLGDADQQVGLRLVERISRRGQSLGSLRVVWAILVGPPDRNSGIARRALYRTASSRAVPTVLACSAMCGLLVEQLDREHRELNVNLLRHRNERDLKVLDRCPLDGAATMEPLVPAARALPSKNFGARCLRSRRRAT